MFPHGLNISSVEYSNPCPYLDIAKAAYWMTKGGFTADGWPDGTAIASALVPLEPTPHNYTLTITGDVKLVRLIASGLILTPDAGGVVTFDATGTDGHGTLIAFTPRTAKPYSFTMVRTDWLPQFRSKQLWTPDFLNVIGSASVLRLMDLCDTNFGKAQTWTPKSRATYNDVAIPIEDMADLSHQGPFDLWFNIPATMPLDEGIRAVLQLRISMPDTAKLHVEWSNEVWNDKFPIGAIANAAPGGDTAFYGQKCAEVGKRLKGVPGVDLILCWQGAQPNLMPKVVAAYKAAGGPMEVLGGLAGAFYICVTTRFPWSTPAEILANLASTQTALESKFAQHIAYAKSLGLPFLKYEEGIDVTMRGATAEQQAMLLEVARSPEATALLEKNWRAFDAAGGAWGCLYTSAGGMFGQTASYGDQVGFPQRRSMLGYNLRAWKAQSLELRAAA